MATTNFTTGTLIESSWLNDVDDITYRKATETISVKDPAFGATGNGSTDDTAAIQAAVNASAGKTLHFPAGSYKITAAIEVQNDVRIIGAGNFQTYVFQYTPNADGFHFSPTTAGTTAAYLGGARIEGMNIAAASAYTATSTAGAGVRFTQCNGYKLFNVSVNNFMEGITIEGGQLGSLKSFQSNASSGIAGPATSALLNFKAAPYGAGLYQKLYTVQVEDFRMSATKLRDSCIRIEDADGINFTNGYIGYGLNDLVRVVHTRDNSYVAGVSFANVYMDCVGVGQTPTAVRLLDDAFTGTNTYDFRLGSGCLLGNGDEYGVICHKPETGLLQVDGVNFVNFKKAAVVMNVQGLTTLSELHVANSKFSNCASDGTNAVIRAAGGRSLLVASNIIGDCGSATAILATAGTYEQGTIIGNVNGCAAADMGNNATYTYGYSMCGNSSKFAKGGVSSWVGTDYTQIGSSVIQATSKATAITLDFLDGQITTAADALAAGAIVSFTFNNAKLRANDIVFVQRKSGGTASSYRVWCDRVVSGVCNICIQNITAAPLSEAIVLQFKVFRSDI